MLGALASLLAAPPHKGFPPSLEPGFCLQNDTHKPLWCPGDGGYVVNHGREALVALQPVKQVRDVITPGRDVRPRRPRALSLVHLPVPVQRGVHLGRRRWIG